MDACTNCVNEYAWRPTDKPFPKECKECEIVDGKPTNFKPKHKTNADRIRAMSDEELAKFFGRYGFCGGVIPNRYCCKQSVCSQECVVRWLKQPAEVDHE